MPEMRREVEVGPFGIHFTNVNTAMKLAGHSHHAEVFLTYASLGPRGFPAFADTYAAIQGRLIELTARPFRDSTNEDVADRIFAAFDGFTAPVIERWGGDHRLRAVELRVRGVPDAIGHADGFTRYHVARGE